MCNGSSGTGGSSGGSGGTLTEQSISSQNYGSRQENAMAAAVERSGHDINNVSDVVEATSNGLKNSAGKNSLDRSIRSAEQDYTNSGYSKEGKYNYNTKEEYSNNIEHSTISVLAKDKDVVLIHGSYTSTR